MSHNASHSVSHSASHSVSHSVSHSDRWSVGEVVCVYVANTKQITHLHETSTTTTPADIVVSHSVSHSGES